MALYQVERIDTLQTKVIGFVFAESYQKAAQKVGVRIVGKRSRTYGYEIKADFLEPYIPRYDVHISYFLKVSSNNPLLCSQKDLATAAALSEEEKKDEGEE